MAQRKVTIHHQTGALATPVASKQLQVTPIVCWRLLLKPDCGAGFHHIALVVKDMKEVGIPINPASSHHSNRRPSSFTKGRSEWNCVRWKYSTKRFLSSPELTVATCILFPLLLSLVPFQVDVLRNFLNVLVGPCWPLQVYPMHGIKGAKHCFLEVMVIFCHRVITCTVHWPIL